MPDEEEKLKSEAQRALFDNVTQIRVFYAGEGDEGCIESEEFLGHDRLELTPTHAQKIAVHDRCYDLLAELPDWVNNDGGRGAATIDIDKNTIFFDHEQYTANGNSESSDDQEVPDSAKPVLSRLAQRVYRVDMDIAPGSHTDITGADERGRDITLTTEEKAELRGVLGGWLMEYPASRDAAEGSERYEARVFCARFQADVTVSWDERASDTTEHTFAFIHGLAERKPAPRGLAQLARRYRQDVSG